MKTFKEFLSEENINEDVIQAMADKYDDHKFVRKIDLDKLHADLQSVGASPDDSIDNAFKKLKAKKPAVFSKWQKLFGESKEEQLEEVAVKEYSWKVVIKSDKAVKDQFEKELDKLFKKYNSKTEDGYIEVL